MPPETSEPAFSQDAPPVETNQAIVDTAQAKTAAEGDAPKSLVDGGEDPAKPVEGEKPPAEAPEAFDPAKLALPEGFKFEGDAAKSFSDIAKEANLPLPVAQKLVDLYASQVKAATQAQADAYQKWTKTQSDWQSEIKSEFGPKLPETLKSLSKAFDQFGTKEARDAFNLTGAGNNPAIFRMFSKMAEALAEGSHVQGKPAGTAPMTTEEKFYPNQPKG